MADLLTGTFVRIRDDADEGPLLRGAYGILVEDERAVNGRNACNVKVFNWLDDGKAWIRSGDLDIMEPDVTARYNYIAQQDGDIPGWREALDNLHGAWYEWSQWVQDLGKDETRTPYAKSLDHLIKGWNIDADHQQTQTLWHELVQAHRELAKVARDWLEG